MTIWFASGNLHKKKELGDILFAAMPGNSFELKIPSEAGLEFDPDETGNTFRDNALIKAEALYRLLEERNDAGQIVRRRGDPVIADDSGICVDALNGRPGIYSARYCGSETNISKDLSQSRKDAEGRCIKLDAAERNALLLSELGDNPRRDARFVCSMVLYFSPDRFYIAQETLEGELVKNSGSARGKGGFGYDPILYLPDLGRTVAELSDEEKNLRSHRGKAARAIAKILFSL